MIKTKRNIKKQAATFICSIGFDVWVPQYKYKRHRWSSSGYFQMETSSLFSVSFFSPFSLLAEWHISFRFSFWCSKSPLWLGDIPLRKNWVVYRMLLIQDGKYRQIQTGVVCWTFPSGLFLAPGARDKSLCFTFTVHSNYRAPMTRYSSSSGFPLEKLPNRSDTL